MRVVYEVRLIVNIINFNSIFNNQQHYASSVMNYEYYNINI